METHPAPEMDYVSTNLDKRAVNVIRTMLERHANTHALDHFKMLLRATIMEPVSNRIKRQCASVKIIGTVQTVGVTPD